MNTTEVGLVILSLYEQERNWSRCMHEKSVGVQLFITSKFSICATNAWVVPLVANSGKLLTHATRLLQEPKWFKSIWHFPGQHANDIGWLMLKLETVCLWIFDDLFGRRNNFLTHVKTIWLCRGVQRSYPSWQTPENSWPMQLGYCRNQKVVQKHMTFSRAASKWHWMADVETWNSLPLNIWQSFWQEK
jgi:hypothetical protein